MLKKPCLQLPKSAISIFGLKMTPPPLELFQKFIRFGSRTLPQAKSWSKLSQLPEMYTRRRNLSHQNWIDIPQSAIAYRQQLMLQHLAYPIKGLSIYYVIWDGGGLSNLFQYHIGGGSPQFITILHRGCLESLLQYYSFEKNMEGYNPSPALNLVKSHHFILVNVDL